MTADPLNTEPITGKHRYVSNACTHAKHELCNKDCHFCGAPCRCACHAGTVASRWGRPTPN